MVEPDNVILEHLRHIRGAVDNVRDDVREIKRRAGSLENQYANMSNRLEPGWIFVSSGWSGVSI